MDRRPDKDDKSVDKLCTAMFSFNDFRNFSRTLLHDKLLLARRKRLGDTKRLDLPRKFNNFIAPGGHFEQKNAQARKKEAEAGPIVRHQL